MRLVPLGFGVTASTALRALPRPHLLGGSVIDHAEVGHADALIVFISLRLQNPLCEDYKLCLQLDPELMCDVS